MGLKFITKEFQTIEQLREEFLGMLRVNLRKPEEDGAVTRECEMFPGLEEYIISVRETPDGGSYMNALVFPVHLEAIGINTADAWETAVKNTSGAVRIDELHAAMNELAMDLYGAPVFTPEELENDGFSLYIVTNEIHFAGAGAILYCKELLKDVSKDARTSRWIAYPSSPHEWILEPDIGMGSLEDRVSIMLGVDRETGQDNRLIDKVYYLTV
ncbi:MAG: hypothetical protein IKF22_11995 [Lachnospiraceae bacterium]|nr:hypothetical protein [Lachnospiraceae bacterium]